jgi:hypothetical protein
LKISLPQKRRAWMDGLFENIKQSELPFNPNYAIEKN